MSRESRILVYGKDNPYARVPEYATIAAVTREDLLNWHKQYAQPNNTIFGITGDFDAKSMVVKLRQAFETWPKGPQAEEPKISLTEAQAGHLLRPQDGHFLGPASACSISVSSVAIPTILP